MQEDESLGFEVALDKVYRGFGPMGFSKIVSAKEVHLQRQRNKFLGRAFCSFFTIPKVAFTFFLFTIGIAPVYLTAPESLPLVCFVVTMFCFLPAAIYFIIVYRRFKKSSKELLGYLIVQPYQYFVISFYGLDTSTLRYFGSNAVLLFRLIFLQ